MKSMKMFGIASYLEFFLNSFLFLFEFSSSSKTKFSDSAIVVNIVSDFDDLFVIFVGGSEGMRSVTVKELPQQTTSPSPQTNNNTQQNTLQRKNEDSVEEEKSIKHQQQSQIETKHHKSDPIQDLSPQQKETLAEELKNEGNQCMQNKMYAEAVTKYTDAISLNPINPVYYANRAQAYLYLKKYNGKYLFFTNPPHQTNKEKIHFLKVISVFYFVLFSVLKFNVVQIVHFDKTH